MARTTEMTEIAISDLKPYKKNAKVHSAEQLDRIKDSIERFGFLSPCLIDKDYNLIAGHGRVQAAKKLKIKKVPCVFIEGLTEKERQAYILADNKLADLGSWDSDLVNAEIMDLTEAGIDMSLFGFDTSHFWQETGAKGDEAYNEFVDKFNTPLTTDDCYTPDNIYAAVKDWCVKTYSLGKAQVIRPFYPGGDYENAKYPAGCVVIDNPPFSILSKIVNFYREREISFFLFAPALTLFSTATGAANYLPIGVPVTYENGAIVSTSFITNLGDYKIDTAPDLYEIVKAENDKNNTAVELPAYKYPEEVITPATITKYVKNGANIKIKASEAKFIRKLDAQTLLGDKAIYGGGFLISKAAAEKAAAEKAAAEKAAAEKEVTLWELSQRELAIIDRLGK